MQHSHLFSGRATRWIAGLVALTLILPLFACGRPMEANSPGPLPPQNNGGVLGNMSTGKKLALLAGAAALYYMYKKHQNAQGAGPQGQYYRSKNGGVYYRDAQGTPHWVTPPSGGIQVPADEAARYQREAQQYGFRDAAPSGNPF